MDQIKLEGLTAEQVELLDIMWEIDQEEEYFSWFEDLEPDVQQQVELLQRLLIMEAIDQTPIDTTQARKYLQQFRL